MLRRPSPPCLRGVLILKGKDCSGRCLRFVKLTKPSGCMASRPNRPPLECWLLWTLAFDHWMQWFQSDTQKYCRERKKLLSRVSQLVVKSLQIKWIEEKNQIFSSELSQVEFLQFAIDNCSGSPFWSWFHYYKKQGVKFQSSDLSWALTLSLGPVDVVWGLHRWCAWIHIESGISKVVALFSGSDSLNSDQQDCCRNGHNRIHCGSVHLCRTTGNACWLEYWTIFAFLWCVGRLTEGLIDCCAPSRV